MPFWPTVINLSEKRMLNFSTNFELVLILKKDHVGEAYRD